MSDSVNVGNVGNVGNGSSGGALWHRASRLDEIPPLGARVVRFGGHAQVTVRQKYVYEDRIAINKLEAQLTSL